MRQDVFIETKNWAAFHEAVNIVSDMQKGQPGMVLVVGQAGRGKTMCCMTHHARSTDTFYLPVEEGWTPRAMLAALCYEVDGSEPRSVEACRRRLKDALLDDPRTIIVDEADRLKNASMIEYFRDLNTHTGSSIVLVGEPSLYNTMKTRSRLWSRLVRIIDFEPVGVEDIMLLGLKSAGLKIPSGPAQSIQRRCSGDFRPAWLDVFDLEIMARANSVDTVTEEMVKALPNRKPRPRA